MTQVVAMDPVCRVRDHRSVLTPLNWRALCQTQQMNHPCKMLIIQKVDMKELQTKEVKDEQMIPLYQPRHFQWRERGLYRNPLP